MYLDGRGPSSEAEPSECGWRVAGHAPGPAGMGVRAFLEKRTPKYTGD
jgi:hypothetical protein